LLAEVKPAEVSPLSQTRCGWCWYIVNAPSGAIDPVEIQADSFDFEAFFHAHYERIARVVARVVGDHGRAEDLAAEAFWKLWRTPQVHGESAGGWLYRTAVRLGLNELRSGRRRVRYEALAGVPPDSLTPEEVHAAAEERDQVRQTLAVLRDRQAELLILRSSGLSYDELAAALGLNPGSVGTLIARAQQAFRKEYIKLYGTRRNGR